MLAEMRDDIVAKQPSIVVGAQLAQAWKMFVSETHGQIAYGRSFALSLDVGERIAAPVDQSFQPFGLGTSVGGRPAVATAYGVAPLATATAHHISEHVTPGAGGSDPRAEAGNSAVVLDPVAISGGFEAANECVCEADCGHSLHYPHVQSMSVQLSDGRVHLSTPLVGGCPKKAQHFRGLDRRLAGNHARAKAWQEGPSKMDD